MNIFNIFNVFKKKESEPSIKESWEELKPILEPYKRTAWFPITEQKDSSPTSSKFAGIPAISKDEEWPCCANCNEPMQLFLQLNSQDIPEAEKGVFGEGILQVFYCTNSDTECEVECEAYMPFATSTLIRVIDYKDDEIASPEESPVKDAYPERQIISWEPKEDYPNWEELNWIGLRLTREQTHLLCDIDQPLPKDKLLGWPHWIQGVEYPDCPECGKPMKFIFQIDSGNNIPYIFGDIGCSHVTQCETHKDKLAIAWACG